MDAPTRARIGTFLAGSSGDRPSLAAGSMVLALFLLGFQDAVVKLINTETSLWQFIMFRALFNIVLIAVLARFIWGDARPRPKRPWAVALRTSFQVGAMIFYFGGIPFLSLAEMAAGLYVFPLFVAVLSVFLLGERVGPRRVGAIAAGFAGALLILKPGTEGFSAVSLMPVAAALCYACGVLATRKLCREESPVTLTFGLAIGFATAGTIGTVVFSLLTPGAWAQSWPYVFTGWHWPGWWILAVFAAVSCLNVAAMTGLGKAYQSAESSWLAPFDYSYLVFATVWGIVFWHHVPDALTIAGMCLIAGAGVFVAWRERQERLRNRAAMG